MNLKQADELLRDAGILSAASSINPIDGGTHPAWRIDVGEDAVFVKHSNRPNAHEMFASEVEGLRVLRRYGKAFRIPEVIHANKNYLVLEFVGHGKKSASAEALAGEALAQLHEVSEGEEFGWATHNFIGPLIQTNDRANDWMTFFTNSRVRPMLDLARPHLNEDDLRVTEELLEAAVTHLPTFKPCIVHGDLWSGNLFYDGQGQPVLIDPAVYYGQPEVDLAMTTMFGGFGEAFYKAYLAACRPDDRYEERLELWNLYPLLVHVALFGAHYVREFRVQTRQLLKSTFTP